MTLMLICTKHRHRKSMAKQIQFILLCVYVFLSVMVMSHALIEAKPCKQSGRIRARKTPKDQCSGDECCESNKFYTTYKHSPSVSQRRKAILTINDFQKGGDGGGPSECDGKYHSNKTPVVALSTRWFREKKRCLRNIIIYANKRSVQAMVVDECDSKRGCANNIVDASEAVWEALDIPKKDWGWMDVFWSDA